MNVTINIIELASELADMELNKYFEYSANSIYVENDDEITTYTEEAQEIFNDLYDKYYSMIEQTIVK